MRLTQQQKPIAVIPYERCAAKTTPEGKPGMSVMAHCRTAGESLDTDDYLSDNDGNLLRLTLRPLSETPAARIRDGNKEEAQ